jgi:hypothetical protein
VHGLWVLAGVLYLVAIARMALHKSAALLPVIALVLEFAGQLASRSVSEAVGVVANPNPSIIALVLPVLLPLALAAMLWGMRRDSSPGAAR